MTPQSIILKRLPEACAQTGFRPTAFYARIKTGTMTPPVKLTERSSAWPEHELSAINAARMAGKSDDEIKQLVRQLVAQRANADAVG